MQSKTPREQLIAVRKRLGHTPLVLARRLQTPVGVYKKWEGGIEPTPLSAVEAAENLPPPQAFDSLGDPLRAAKYRAIIADLKAGVSRREVAAKHDVRLATVQYLVSKCAVPRAPSARTRAIVTDLTSTNLSIHVIAERHGVSYQHVAFLRKQYAPDRPRARKDS